MLQLELTTEDLRNIRVLPDFAPMIELVAFLRSGDSPLLTSTMRRWRAATSPRVDPAAAGMVADLIHWGCTPGFMTPAVADPLEAVEAVARTEVARARRDLVENVEAGWPLPSWTAGLAERGPAALRLRHRLAGALVQVQQAALDPVLDRLRPIARTQSSTLLHELETAGGATVLDRLHPRIRLRGTTLEVDLASGAQVEVVSRGGGLTLVPTLLHTPSVTVSSDGSTPSVITVPLAMSTPLVLSGLRGAVPSSDALAALIGASRARVLETVADHPGTSTRGLARRIDLSPASVSEHATVLRANGLIDTTRGRSGAAHFLTELGFDLLSAP